MSMDSTAVLARSRFRFAIGQPSTSPISVQIERWQADLLTARQSNGRGASLATILQTVRNQLERFRAHPRDSFAAAKSAAKQPALSFERVDSRKSRRVFVGWSQSRCTADRLN